MQMPAGHASEQEVDKLHLPLSMPPPPASCTKTSQYALAAHSAWLPRNRGLKGPYLTGDVPTSARGGNTAPATAIPTRPGLMIPGLSTSHGYGGAVPWTSSEAGDPFINSNEAMGPPEQSLHVLEYNSLADKYGLPPLLFSDDPEEFPISQDAQAADTRNWFARAFGKTPASTSRRSSRQSAKSEKSAKHRRSESDTTSQAVQHGKPDQQKSTRDLKDALKNETLQSLVRLCGKSLLYLPSEYAPRSLTLPTCIRAAAQYLAQNGPETRGVFRISGSTRVVGELYDYYCVNIDEADIAATVRSPNLPFHINYSVHDVASVFKRILAGLPGGILGHLSLFDALVSIHRTFLTGSQGSQGNQGHQRPNMGDCDSVRARLIALAIESVPSPLQRELICAVFGILCLIGRAAEAAAAREDVYGSRFPNSELMGFGALGIIFGPLLLGDYLSLYSSDGSDDSFSSFFVPPAFAISSSPRSRADRRRKSTASDKRSQIAASLTLDKVLLANSVAEMLITSWNLVVEQMDGLAIMRKQSLAHHQRFNAQQKVSRVLRPSRSETFSDMKQRGAAPQTTRSRQTDLRKTRSGSVSFIRRSSTSHAAVGGQQTPFWPLFRRPVDGAPENFAARKGSVTEKTAERRSEVAAVPSADVTTTVVTQAVAALAALSPTDEKAPHFDTRQSAAAAVKPPKSPQRSQDSDIPSIDNGLTVQNWRAKLKPVDPTVQNTDKGTVNARATVEVETPFKRAPQDRGATSSRRSSFGALTSGIDGSPSKTAALIARIMNPRTTTAPTTPQTKRIPLERSDAPDWARENTTAVGRRNAPTAMRSADVDGGILSETRNKWSPKTNGFVGTPNDQRWLAQVSTPTPKGRWRAQTSPTPVAEYLRDRSHIGSPYMPKQSGNMENQPIAPSPNRQQIVTRKPLTGANDTLRHKFGLEESMSLNSQEQVPSKNSGLRSPRQQSPLSEIKNEAKGMYRTYSLSSKTTPKGPKIEVTVLTMPDGPSVKSTAGGTVKAMAAMFDSAVRAPPTDTIPPTQAQPAQTRDTPKTPNSALKQHMTNYSLAKVELATPSLRRTPTGFLPLKGSDETGSPASIRDLAREKRRLRLSRSEGRSALPGSAPLSNVRGRDIAQSTDRRDTKADDTEELVVRNVENMRNAKNAKNAEVRSGIELPSHGSEHSTRVTRQDLQRGKGQLLDRGGLGEKEVPSSTHPSSTHPSSTQTSANSSPSLTRRGIELSRTPGTPGTPGQYGISPVLKAQLQDLRQQLEAKTVECAGWKKRAEAAERAVTELECYASKLYIVEDGMGSEDDDTDSSNVSDNSNMTVVVHSRMSNEAVLRVMM